MMDDGRRKMDMARCLTPLYEYAMLCSGEENLAFGERRSVTADQVHRA